MSNIQNEQKIIKLYKIIKFINYYFIIVNYFLSYRITI